VKNNPSQLTEEEHQEIFDEEIKPKLFKNTESILESHGFKICLEYQLRAKGQLKPEVGKVKFELASETAVKGEFLDIPEFLCKIHDKDN
jgi:hypothetical protein